MYVIVCGIYGEKNKNVSRTMAAAEMGKKK